MGVYDLRCSVSGVSLKGQRCWLTLLRQRSAGHFEPVWSPIGGKYNRVGSIDVRDDIAQEVAYVRRALDRLRAAGRLAGVDGAISRDVPLFELFLPSGRDVTLDGERLLFSLTHHRLIDGMRDELTPDGAVRGLSECSSEELYAEAFHGLQPIAPYSEELGAMTSFRSGAYKLPVMRAWHQHHQPWNVPTEAAQHGDAEVQRYVDEGRARLAAWPMMKGAVDLAASLDFFVN